MWKLGLSRLLLIGSSVFFLSILALALTGCAGETGAEPLFVPDPVEEGVVLPTETLDGVWLLKDQNTPSYFYHQGSVIVTGTLHDWVVLVNPPTSGDRVYNEKREVPGMETPILTFFFRDQLVRQKMPVYKVRMGARSYRETGTMGEISIPDEYDWQNEGGTFPYLTGTTLRIKDNHPSRVYLTNDEVPVGWIKDGNWAHFFRREDVVLLNPDCPPEEVSPSKL